jgi:hypothetical protein
MMDRYYLLRVRTTTLVKTLGQEPPLAVTVLGVRVKLGMLPELMVPQGVFLREGMSY